MFESYIKGFPSEISTKLSELYKLLSDLLPNAEQVFAYGVPTFKLDGKNFVHFGGFKDHVSFFPGGGRAIEQFSEELRPYKTSKGTIQISVEQELPKKLITDIVHYLLTTKH